MNTSRCIILNVENNNGCRELSTEELCGIPGWVITDWETQCHQMCQESIHLPTTSWVEVPRAVECIVLVKDTSTPACPAGSRELSSYSRFNTSSAAKSRLTEGMWGTFLAVQWLGFHASTAGGMGSIPGWGTKILRAAQPKIKINKGEVWERQSEWFI